MTYAPKSQAERAAVVAIVVAGMERAYRAGKSDCMMPDWLGIEKEAERVVPPCPTKRRQLQVGTAIVEVTKPEHGNAFRDVRGGGTWSLGCLLAQFVDNASHTEAARQLLDLIDRPDEPDDAPALSELTDSIVNECVREYRASFDAQGYAMPAMRAAIVRADELRIATVREAAK